MQDINHPEMVRRLVKPGAEILNHLTPDKLTLLGAASYIYQEAARILDAVALPNFIGELKQSGLTAEEQAIWTDLVHAAVGITTEAGELLDAIKKLVVYNKPLDRVNVIEELGDLEFYSEQWDQNPTSSNHYHLDILRAEMKVIRDFLSVSREEVLQANIEKLRVRYEGLVYSDQSAQERADKQG